MHAAIFPGQGSQEVGMGADAAAQLPVAGETFAQADALLGLPLSKLCFEGPADKLNATDIQQPAIFTTSVALFRAGVDRGKFKADQFAYMAGLSLGEYTALHLAGAIAFEDALRLVYRRGQLMQAAAEAAPGGMVSLLGMDEPAALRLCEAVVAHGTVRPANFNCPGQIVISGDKVACDAAAALADQHGGRAIPLDVAGAFHSDLMRPAAEALRETLAATEIRRPGCQVVSNVDVEVHGGPGVEQASSLLAADAIRDSLYRQVFNPVRWQMCVEHMIAAGVSEFWEIGPKRVLTGLNRKIDRSAKTTSISKAADLG